MFTRTPNRNHERKCQGHRRRRTPSGTSLAEFVFRAWGPAPKFAHRGRATDPPKRYTEHLARNLISGLGAHGPSPATPTLKERVLHPRSARAAKNEREAYAHMIICHRRCTVAWTTTLSLKGPPTFRHTMNIRATKPVPEDASPTSEQDGLCRTRQQIDLTIRLEAGRQMTMGRKHASSSMMKNPHTPMCRQIRPVS